MTPFLTKKRKTLHEEIGKAIEGVAGTNLDQHYSALAAHFIAGENYAKGAEYSKLAIRKAEKSAALNDAITHAKRRVACIEKLPQNNESKKMMVTARTVLGLYETELNHFAAAKEAIQPIVNLGLSNIDIKRRCQILTILGAHHIFIDENFPQAFSAFEEALKLAEDLKDILTLVLGSFFLAFALAHDSQFERASSHFQRAIDINVAFKNLWGIATMKGNFTCACHYWAGKVDVNFRTAADALRAAEESGDSLSMGITHTVFGISNFAKGYLEQAEAHLKKGVELCEKNNMPTWLGLGAYFNMAEMYFELAKFPLSQEKYRQMIMVSEDNQLYPSWVNLAKAGVAKAGVAKTKVLNHENDVDVNSICNSFQSNRVRAVEGWMARYIGEILLNIDDQHFSQAEHWLEKAIAADQKNGMMFELGRAYVLYAELFKRRGDRITAQETLGKAIEILKECGADGWVNKYENELSTI